VRRIAPILAIVLAAASVALASSAASAATLSTARARGEIGRLAAAAYPDLEIGNIACPPTVRRADGATFTCTAQIPGGFLVVDAEQDGTTGAVTLTTPNAVLAKSALEQFVASNATIGATVDCGPAPVIVRRPGQTVTCRAALEDGTTRTVTLSVRDPAGTVVVAAVG